MNRNRVLFLLCLLLASPAAIAQPPIGDAARGRAAFLKYNCHSCHAVVHDGSLPEPSSGIAAPVLGGLRAVPKSMIEEEESRFRQAMDLPEPDTRLETYVMSIVQPERTIAPGFARGSVEDEPVSDMPHFEREMTVEELRDIVAYLLQS